MFDYIMKLASHTAPFLGVMGQVVTIWGFLNFINQLNLQNLTLVADRALSRLSGLKHAIFILKTSDEKDIETALDSVTQITKRLYMDLKQLGIAKDYDMKHKISLLSQSDHTVQEIRTAYLQYELGSVWNANVAAVGMVVPYLQKLENQLLDIFDLSHGGQTFMTHVRTNVLRVSWLSLVIYSIECHNFVIAASLFVCGVIFFVINRYIYRQE